MKHIEVCAAVLVNKNNEILATQRQGGTYDGKWEFPGGKMEAGETHQDTLIRELKEELDIVIAVDEFIMTIGYQYPEFYLTMHCYYCHVIRGEIKLLEHQDLKWLDKESLHTVDWLEADIDVIAKLKKRYKVQSL